jgi:hypothetical protein
MTSISVLHWYSHYIQICMVLCLKMFLSIILLLCAAVFTFFFGPFFFLFLDGFGYWLLVIVICKVIFSS